MAYATWLADDLRAAGIQVVETPGWKERGHGGSFAPWAVVWHHDGSPVGDSPGLPAYLIARWDVASANIWINRQGVVYLIAAGTAWHAGKVFAGMPGNQTSIGIETDHTVGEDWTPELLDALRKTSAVIFQKLSRRATSSLFFHKQIASPLGRKVDPAGLDIEPERSYVQRLLDGDIPLTGGGSTPVITVPVINVPKPAPGERVLGLGDNGQDVKDLQTRLNVFGYGLVVDGDFGPATESAVKAFQDSHGLAADGVVGPATRTALAHNPAPPARPKANVGQVKAIQSAIRVTADGKWGTGTDSTLSLVRDGAQGRFPDIKRLQKAVGVTADGKWGPKSKAALADTVKALQRAFNVSADGKWGPQTDSAYTDARNLNFNNF